MFRAPLRPSLGAQQLQKQALVFPLERGGSSAAGRGRAGYSWLIYLNFMMMHRVANFKSPASVSILRPTIPVHVLACYFLKIHFNIIHTSTPANPPNTKLD
jgi:hypothetical protein